MITLRWSGAAWPDLLAPDAPADHVVERRVLEAYHRDSLLGGVGVAWERSRLLVPRARAWEAVLGPFRFTSDAYPAGEHARAAVVRAALREIVWGSHAWHAITVLAGPDELDLLDAAWRYGTQRGFHCVVDPVRPPRRDEHGRIEPGCYAVRLYSRSARALLLAARRAAPAVAEQGAAIGAAAVARFRRRRRPVGVDTRYFVLDLHRLPPPVPWPEGLRLREIDEAEIARDPLRYGMSLDQADRSLQRGDRCLAAYVGDELAHHRWWSTDRRHIETLIPSRQLRWPVVFAYDGFTHVPFRGRGIQPATLRWVAEHAAGAGARQVVVRVHVANASSQRGIRKAGFVPLERDG